MGDNNRTMPTIAPHENEKDETTTNTYPPDTTTINHQVEVTPSAYMSTLDRHQHHQNTIQYRAHGYNNDNSESFNATEMGSIGSPNEQTEGNGSTNPINNNSPYEVHPNETTPIYQQDSSSPPGRIPHPHHQHLQHLPIPQHHHPYYEPPPYSSSSFHQQHWSYHTTAHETTCACNPCHMLSTLLHAENIHRSFCFGAIDGLLTGSGIAAAACGLGLFDPYAPLQERLLIVALSFAACAADGVCMGIGHIWSTYILQEGAAKEREREVADFRERRGESKARLVDALLMRGMLKIDAMSVADTLEGYPDIFLSAIIGDGGGPLGFVAERVSTGMLAEGAVGYPTGYNQPMSEYSRYDEFAAEDDEGCAGDAVVMAESRNEGAVMMMAFSLFSVFPAIIYAFVPIWINPDHNELVRSYQGDGLGDTGVSATTVAVSINSFIMLLLGFWKSKFFSSSWIVFGIETVLVLILCIMSAYGLGYVLGQAINY